MNNIQTMGAIFLFVLSTFSALLTQHRGWIVAAVLAALVVGRGVGRRPVPSEPPLC